MGISCLLYLLAMQNRCFEFKERAFPILFEFELNEQNRQLNMFFWLQCN
jgi:hypothetical protein